MSPSVSWRPWNCMRQSKLPANLAKRSIQRWKPGSNSALEGTATCMRRIVLRGWTTFAMIIWRFSSVKRFSVKIPQKESLSFLGSWRPMMISLASYSLKACMMPLAIFVAMRLWVCIRTFASDAAFVACSSSWRPKAWFFCTLSSSSTTLSPIIPRFRASLRIKIARLTNVFMLPWYFSGSSIFSSSPTFSSSWMTLSLRAIFWEANSVINEEMTHVKRIIITTPLSISASTR